MKKSLAIMMVVCMMLTVLSGCGTRPVEEAPESVSLWEQIQNSNIVELSREVSESTPHQADFPTMEVTPVLTFEEDECYSNAYNICSQYGTHVDVPIHFFEGAKTLDEYEVSDLIMPLCVIDVSSKTAENPDYVITMDDVTAYEEKNGIIPEKAFVAMRTDWSKERNSIEELENCDSNGQAHYPGWSLEVVEFLCNERNVAAIGHEPGDTDPGLTAVSSGWAVEAAFLETGRFQVEMMCNLDQVPESGALVIVSFPKIVGAGGFPARVIAVCPN
jgi:kynurenine formamidase